MPTMLKSMNAVCTQFKAIILEPRLSGIVFETCELMIPENKAEDILQNFTELSLVICEIDCRSAAKLRITALQSPYQKSEKLLYISNCAQSKKGQNPFSFKDVTALKDAVNLAVMTQTPVVAALKKDLPDVNTPYATGKDFKHPTQKSSALIRPFYKGIGCYQKYYTLMSADTFSELLTSRQS